MSLDSVCDKQLKLGLPLGAPDVYETAEALAEADRRTFVSYVCLGLADAFAKMRAAAVTAGARAAPDLAERLRQLDPRGRRLLELFRAQYTATTAEIAQHLGLGHRTVVTLARTLVADGFLELADPSRKNRAYRLSVAYSDLASAAD